MLNCLLIKKNYVYLHSQLGNGALAHLARALDWQSKGDEFESRMLHNPIKVLGYAKDSFFRIANFVFLPIFVQEN